LYEYCKNAPLNFVDAFGLAIVVNNTTNCLMASGNQGVGPSGGGAGAVVIYAVLPPGETGGGALHPLDGYETPEIALAVYDGGGFFLPEPAGQIFDIDHHYCPVKCEPTLISS